MIRKSSLCTIFEEGKKGDLLTIDERTIAVDLAAADFQTLASFYIYVKKVLKFPSYFRKNLDSLDECLCDLSWLHVDKVHIILSNFEDFLCNEKKNVKYILLQLLYEVATHWKANNKLVNVNQHIEFIIFIEDNKNLRSDLEEYDISFSSWDDE